MRDRTNSVASLLPLMALGLSIAGGGLQACAHYGLGAAPDQSETDHEVAVATVAVPASFGVDSARLTRELVDELRRRGLSKAVWGESGERGADVRCVVDGPESRAFGTAHRAQLSARCEVDVGGETKRVRGFGQQTATVDRSRRTGLSTVQHAAVETAAADAIADAAPKIARALRNSRR